MKAKINGIEVEGTVEEVVAFYDEINKRNTTEISKTYTIHPSIALFPPSFMPQVTCKN
ncbi:hypothetical protein [Paenibacillus xylanexedens]|uniref:hypothetical protein n=1 Tax=Paenibacillus xylanexedens TaxID=528191 RepID=UPI001642646D|nr:hypothetical protein [Paenibacillus xylanexedens]